MSLYKHSGLARLPPLQDNGIKRVKMFDADPDSLKALVGTGIEVSREWTMRGESP